VRRDTYGIPAAKPREAECKPTPPKKGGRINPPKKPEMPLNMRFVRKRKFKDLTNSTKNSPRTATGARHGEQLDREPAPELLTAEQTTAEIIGAEFV
jgi:hypothetical protein